MLGVGGFWLDVAEAVAQAAPAAATATAAASSTSVTGQLTQLVLGLLLVLGLIFFLAWLLRRVQNATPGGRQAIEILGTRALGPRDRLLLVQVGKEQILIGHTPGNLTALHVMNEPVEVSTPARQAQPEFAQRLMELLGKDQKDKS
ncbi:flagellar biosynthetic protein FliO [Pseudomonas sp. SDI]|nr:flagellar biosynthetic protein FliO [Pseudomonas sp. SDI]